MSQSKPVLQKKTPDWFSLNNYAEAKNLNSYGWWLHLARRKAALDCLDRGLGYDLSGFFKNPILSKSDIESTRAKLPLVSPIVNSIPQAPKLEGVNLYTDTVRSLPLYWLAFGEHEDSDVIDAVQNMRDYNSTNSDKELLFTPYDLYLKEKKGVENDGLLMIEIDSNATDEKIIEDFAIWLKAARSEFGSTRKKAFTQITFGEWINYGVLPYLDLQIWSKSEAVRLTQNAIGEALYADQEDLYSDTTERIRRTTAPKAKWLMDSTVLRALEIQAESDIKATLKTR